MKRIKMLCGATLALVLTSSMIFAQGGPQGRQGKKGMNPEARKALKSYVQSTVVPVVEPIRTQFDQQLSSTEQQELADIRQGLAAMKAEQREHRQEMRPQRDQPGERPVLTEAQEAEKREQAKAKRLLMTRAWAIADAHEAELEAVFADLRPQADTWRKEMRELMEQHRPTDAPANRPEGAKHEGKRGPRGPHKGGMRGSSMLRQLQSPVGFLLWEPGADLMAEPDEMASIRAYPNPTADQMTVQFSAQKPGTVQIRLISDMGEPIKTVYSGKAVVGTNQVQIDLSGVAKGAYLMQIQGPDGPQTLKIVKE